MKTWPLSILILILLISFKNPPFPPFLKGGEGGLNHAIAEEAQDTIILNVRGMSCSQCTKRVEGELKKINGVKNAEASLKEAKVKITVEKGKVTAEQLTEAINNMGYWVEKKK